MGLLCWRSYVDQKAQCSSRRFQNNVPITLLINATTELGHVRGVETDLFLRQRQHWLDRDSSALCPDSTRRVYRWWSGTFEVLLVPREHWNTLLNRTTFSSSMTSPTPEAPCLGRLSVSAIKTASQVSQGVAPGIACMLPFTPLKLQHLTHSAARFQHQAIPLEESAASCLKGP